MFRYEKYGRLIIRLCIIALFLIVFAMLCTTTSTATSTSQQKYIAPLWTETAAEMRPSEIMLADIYYPLTYDERDLVERLVCAEAGDQPITGQMAVAWTILNTAVTTNQTATDVIYTPNQYATPVNSEDVSELTRTAVSRVFDNGEAVTDEPIRYFYSTRGGFYSRWHENNLEYVATIGNHRFFKESETK